MSNEIKYVFTIDQLKRFCECHIEWWWEDEDENPKWDDFLRSDQAAEFLEHAKKSEP